MAKRRFLAGLVENWRCRGGNSSVIKESVIPSRVNTIVIKFMFPIILEHQVFGSLNSIGLTTVSIMCVSPFFSDM